VALLLKLLPCLEHQQKGSSIEILKKLPCKYAVISFPVKSLGGKKSGMVDFYSNNFKSMIEKEPWQVVELLFETELVFVVKK
jgi:16S rRNA (guanine(1405)-N(7))-methyltransferase